MRKILILMSFVSVVAHARVDRIQFDLPFRRQIGATCWAYCGTTTLDLKASAKIGKPVSFSVDYIVLHDYRSRALARFHGHQTPWDPGAGMTRAYAISLEHGLIPDDVWNRPDLARVFRDLRPAFELLITQSQAEGLSGHAFLA